MRAFRSLLQIPRRSMMEQIDAPAPNIQFDSPGSKWTCRENSDGSLTLSNHTVHKRLYINATCVQYGCVCYPVFEEWVHLCATPHQCRTVKGPIVVKRD